MHKVVVSIQQNSTNIFSPSTYEAHLFKQMEQLSLEMSRYFNSGIKLEIDAIKNQAAENCNIFIRKKAL